MKVKFSRTYKGIKSILKILVERELKIKISNLIRLLKMIMPIPKALQIAITVVAI
jgi:hypothetical protein